ncbi:MAG: hypothetical protein UT63_C0024G0001 [Candidatus Gottesmanbacteria bacterium GW2011_GWC2_39_8]|uniref:Uncharacterized protein n=1 Tax=Candidatus Gottesmanbacteria bacterium GW2011_GWC2_39_8 TaxID=1618450 RepID=A0A0G0PY52_9BACT|nr:MAG: hypothetical protein UT63_C0024G0001 [Candidatus Gottesmanbacteria bacterium GW2011_GWC2_39_8]
MSEEKQKEPGITILNTLTGSVYSQLVGVVVTDTELTLEFVYINPRPGVKEGQVVARVTLPVKASESLAGIIVDTVRQHEEKKGKKNASKSN